MKIGQLKFGLRGSEKDDKHNLEFQKLGLINLTGTEILKIINLSFSRFGYGWMQQGHISRMAKEIQVRDFGIRKVRADKRKFSE